MSELKIERGRRIMRVSPEFLAMFLRDGSWFEVHEKNRTVRYVVEQGLPDDATTHGAGYSWESNALELWVSSETWEPDDDPGMLPLATWVAIVRQEDDNA